MQLCTTHVFPLLLVQGSSPPPPPPPHHTHAHTLTSLTTDCQVDSELYCACTLYIVYVPMAHDTHVLECCIFCVVSIVLFTYMYMYIPQTVELLLHCVVWCTFSLILEVCQIMRRLCFFVPVSDYNTTFF